jgi:hypothetical protein
MEAQIKSCQNCKKDFTIETEDFSFYEKIKVPPPTWCPECRMIRRMACHNGWSLFYRNCDKCGERILSMYPPTQKIVVYCQPCWWADDWDGTEYAMDYDPDRSFLEQVKELSDKTPYPATETAYLTVKNCDYSNALGYSKNCTLAIWADYCEFVYHSSILYGVKYSSECLRANEVELCYENVGTYKCYNTFFSDECDACVNVWFSRDCYGCTDCVGCVNLRGATNCIFNVKYTKEEYKKKIKEFGLNSWSKLREIEKQAHEFWLTKPYRECNGHTLSVNVTGEHVYNSKNSKECYIVKGAENCKWCQFITFVPAKDCMDYSGWGSNAELVYESFISGENVNNIKFSGYCWSDSINSEYCFWCIVSKNNFGCVNLKRKSYCVLNKEYSKEEYKVLCEKIVEDMKKNPYIDEQGRAWFYGEFFQPGFSKFAYNGSTAYKFFPKTKEESLKCGYTWNEEEQQQNDTTILGKNLPETIGEVGDLILKEVISCINCNRKYKIADLELSLLRKMGIPLPRECLKCRDNKLFSRLTKPKMHHRVCMKCNTDIYTPYAPDDPRIVYCVKCYQAEFA